MRRKTILLALVLTLFGKYYGTINKAGYFFVNPFARYNNPAYEAQAAADAAETTENIKSVVEKISNLNQTRLIVTDDKGLIIYDTLGGGNKYALLPQIVSALRNVDTFTWHYVDGVPTIW